MTLPPPRSTLHTLALHDARPISSGRRAGHLPVAAHPRSGGDPLAPARGGGSVKSFRDRNPYTVGLVSVLVIGAITGMAFLVGLLHLLEDTYEMEDRKSTRLNSSH